MMVQRPGCLAAKQVGLEGGIEQAEPEPFAEARTNISHLVQLFPQPALAQAFRIGFDLFVTLIADLLKDCFRGHHGAFHGGMGTLDLGHVEKTGGITYQ